MSNVSEELEKIRVRHGGILHPQEVVNAAREKTSPLHKHFDWNDSEAAEKYRLAQARALIRVSVSVDKSPENRIRAFVSITTDRYAGGGYRSVAEVMTDEELCRQMLEDALHELQTFKTKYETLRTTITPVFDAIENVSRARIVHSFKGTPTQLQASA